MVWTNEEKQLMDDIKTVLSKCLGARTTRAKIEHFSVLVHLLASNHGRTLREKAPSFNNDVLNKITEFSRSESITTDRISSWRQQLELNNTAPA